MLKPSQSTSTSAAAITGARIARNTLWNVTGQVLPLAAAVVCMPVIIDGLGVERFGLLALCWMVIGYFGLFDFGIGRALTKLIAVLLAAGENNRVATATHTALVLTFVFGALGGALLVHFSQYISNNLLQISGEFAGEATKLLVLLGASLPVVIASASVRGALEAYHRFDLVNAVRLPLGLFSFVGPALGIVLFSMSLTDIVLLLVFARILALLAYACLCRKCIPGFLRSKLYDRSCAYSLLATGGWMSVSNVISPLMVYIDRFLIAGMLSLGAVTYYVTPYEIVTKIWLIPVALVSVLFPVFSTLIGTDPKRASTLYRQSIVAVFTVVYPICVVILCFGEQGLGIWLGQEFSDKSAVVLQLLALGVMVNCLGQIPYALLQSAGRSDLTAYLHLIELPFYCALLWILLKQGSIEGAALAWLIRVLVDTVLLFVSVQRNNELPRIDTKPFMTMLGLMLLASLSIGIEGVMANAIFASLVLVLYVFSSWRYIVEIWCSRFRGKLRYSRDN